MATESKWLTPAELAEMLEIPASTIRKWIHSGQCGTGPAGEAVPAPPSYKIGRHRRFARSEVEQWLADRRVDPASAA